MLFQLFWSFFKIGAVTFGSGLAMIPVVEKEVVDRKKWFSREDFYDHFALAQSTPGPVALNTAVFVGYRQRGFIGAAVAVMGAALPSFLIILTIALVLQGFRDNLYVNAAFRGLMPAVVALIAVPFVKFLKPLKWPMICLGVAAALAIWQGGFSPVWVIALGILVGVAEVLIKDRRGRK